MCVGDEVERKKEDPCPAPTRRLLPWGKLKGDPGKERAKGPTGRTGGQRRLVRWPEAQGKGHDLLNAHAKGSAALDPRWSSRKQECLRVLTCGCNDHRPLRFQGTSEVISSIFLLPGKSVSKLVKMCRQLCS